MIVYFQTILIYSYFLILLLYNLYVNVFLWKIWTISIASNIWDNLPDPVFLKTFLQEPSILLLKSLIYKLVAILEFPFPITQKICFQIFTCVASPHIDLMLSSSLVCNLILWSTHSVAFWTLWKGDKFARTCMCANVILPSALINCLAEYVILDRNVSFLKFWKHYSLIVFHLPGFLLVHFMSFWFLLCCM